jgi:hypothetical protein
VIAEISPRGKARLVAVLTLVTIVAGIIAQGFIAERFIALGDAARTAANVAANPSLYRLGFTIYMVEMIAQIASIVFLYDLLKPVDRSVARTAAIIGITGCGMKTFARLFYYAPLLLGTGGAALTGFSDAQLQALSIALLRLNEHGPVLALVFFGVENMLEGWLMIRSTFLPRFLGIISIIGGLGWVTFLWPPTGYALFMGIALFGLVGSVVMIGWLLVKGVDETRWLEQARLATTSIWR